MGLMVIFGELGATERLSTTNTGQNHIKASQCCNIVKLLPATSASWYTAYTHSFLLCPRYHADPEGFKLENTAQNCIEPSPQKKVVLPCTYTGVDYERMTVKWYRVTKNTGCCARPAADYKYWKVPVNVETLRNHTAKSVTVQLVIDHFNTSYSGLYFCQAYNLLHPNTHIQSDHITEVAPTGSESLSMPHMINYTMLHVPQMQSQATCVFTQGS